MRLRTFLGSLFAMTLILTACGNDDDSASRGAESGSGGPTSAESSEDGSRAEIDRDATLRFAYQNPITPATFDPHRAPSRNDLTPLSITYDRLIMLAADGSLEPSLATDWTFSDDGLTLTLTLRDDVTFHDGSVLDATAVQQNLERARDIEGGTQANHLAAVESIDVVSDYELDINLSQEAAQLPASLAEMAGMIINPNAFDSPELDEVGAGSGMYRVREHKKDNQIHYERYEDYWDPEAAAASEIILFVRPDPAARVNAVISGQADVAARIGPQVISQAQNGDVVLYEKETTEFWHVWMNRSGILSDQRVRQAVSHAIDREGIVATALNGRGIAAGQPVPEESPFFDPDTGNDPYPYDRDRARGLLAEAGADGASIELIAYAQPFYQQMNEILQDQLSAVGLDVTVTTTTEIAMFVARAEGDAAPSQGTVGVDPTLGFQLLFTEEGRSNPGGHSTPEAEAAIRETMVVQDEEARIQAIRDAIAQLTEDVLVIPIFFETITTASSPQVVGLQAQADASVSFRGVGLAAS